MGHSFINRMLSCALSLLMVFSVGAPAAAMAAVSNVQVENHTQSEDRMTISNVRIDGVSTPQAGTPLDDTAVVEADPSVSWEIPVLWVSDDLTLTAEAEEGKTYLPALAFYIPDDYALEGDSYTVTLSDSLTKLFGGKEIISVFDASTGITYILPASIRDFFGARQDEGTSATSGTAEREQAVPAPETNQQDERDKEPVAEPGESLNAVPADKPGDESADKPAEVPSEVPGEAPADVSGENPEQSVVDIYCAQSAKDALSQEDLEWLIDLIIHTLEPQAVELLLDSFPAFNAAAQNGEIGTQIGMYVYYLNGDKDGLREHETAPSTALAYVATAAVADGDVYKYCYLLGINVDDLLEKDDDDEPVRDETTGKLRLVRDGSSMRTFENTIVHELFHAFMDDYNRTGMAGVTNTQDFVVDTNGNFLTKELEDRYNILHFPSWFIEGTASATENVYQFRKSAFNGLRTDANGQVQNEYTTGTLFDCYLDGKLDGEFAYYDLGFCNGYDSEGNNIDNSSSAYVSGYLASLYLADLAATKNTGSSAIVIENDKIVDVSTQKLRLGLDSMLERMHQGETLDQVIADISPSDNSGNKLYKDTADFQDKFIKGPETGKDANGKPQYDAKGDESSLAFVADYLNYLEYVSGQEGRANEANGSILFPVDEDYNTPLDDKQTTSDYFQIVESNKAVESTVPDSVALAGGGKSDPNAALAAASEEEPLQDEAETNAGPETLAPAAKDEAAGE